MGSCEEIDALEKHRRVKKLSSLFKPDPTVDNGLLRVGGRLSRAVMPMEAKHPAILPKNAHVSQLIISHAHQEVRHSGRNYVLSLLRQRYWIIRANAAVRSVSTSVSFVDDREAESESKRWLIFRPTV